MSDEQRSPWRYAHLGLELAGAAIILGAVGWWVDQRFATEPWAMVIGGVVGFIGGFYLFIKEALKALADSENEGRTDKRDET